MRVERIEADYFIETAHDVRKAVEAMAGEQPSGTFVPVPGETPELKARSAARVEKLEVLGEADQPSLPGSGAPREGRVRLTARATLSWPLDNIGPSLPNLMATVAGNLFELKQFSGLRILDIRLPDAFASAYPGPKFQRIRRERNTIGPGLSHADVRGQAVHRDASVFIRPIGPSGGGNTCRAGIYRSHFRCWRRDHGPS